LVFVSHFEVVLLGKTPGKTQFEIYDDKGVKEAFELKVDRPLDPFLSHIRSFYKAFIRGIGVEKPALAMSPLETNAIEFSEQPTTDVIHLKPSQPKFFKLDNSIVRTSTADPEHAELALISSNELMLAGKKRGRTTIFLWDEVGRVAKLDVDVSGSNETETSTLVHSKIIPSTNSTDGSKTISEPVRGPSAPAATRLQEVETWTGSKKDVLSVPRVNDSNGE
jgi:Flp pilus assembly secretin CpaC